MTEIEQARSQIEKLDESKFLDLKNRVLRYIMGEFLSRSQNDYLEDVNVYKFLASQFKSGDEFEEYLNKDRTFWNNELAKVASVEPAFKETIEKLTNLYSITDFVEKKRIMI